MDFLDVFLDNFHAFIVSCGSSDFSNSQILLHVILVYYRHGKEVAFQGKLYSLFFMVLETVS